MLMCSLKTGCLARFAAHLGAEAAHIFLKTKNQSLHDDYAVSLGDAAQKLGVGFQILDDVKNLKGSNTGKDRGDDIAEGKKSLPVLLFLQKDKNQAAFVRRCFTAAKEGGTMAIEVEELIQALSGAGVLEEAEKQGKALIAEAGTVFCSLLSDNLPAADSDAGRLLAGLPELLQ